MLLLRVEGFRVTENDTDLPVPRADLGYPAAWIKRITGEMTNRLIPYCNSDIFSTAKGKLVHL